MNKVYFAAIMKKQKTKKKKRPSHYEKPLIIDGTFADVIKVAVRDDEKKAVKK